MKTNNLYLNRLLKFARHIGKQHLQEVLLKKTKRYTATKTDSSIEHFAWALKELPKIAPSQWMIHEGLPCLTSTLGLNSLTCAGIFFKLSADELFHLFVPGYQDPTYMGKVLGDDATPDELANNIYQFVSYKEKETSGKDIPLQIKNSQEKKVIKKLKYKNAA